MFGATGLCLLRFQEPLFRLSSVVPPEGKCQEAAGQNELYVGRGTADYFWQPSICQNPFRVSEVGSAARAVELSGHTEGLVVSAAVFGWKTFALPLQR